MTTAILTIVAAALPLAVAIIKWWLDGREGRARQKAMEDTDEMGMDVADGDTASISDRLRRLP